MQLPWLLLAALSQAPATEAPSPEALAPAPVTTEAPALPNSVGQAKPKPKPKPKPNPDYCPPCGRG